MSRAHRPPPLPVDPPTRAARSRRIAAIRRRITDGSYHVPPDLVAEALFEAARACRAARVRVSES